jgi:hypothetical protein
LAHLEGENAQLRAASRGPIPQTPVRPGKERAAVKPVPRTPLVAFVEEEDEESPFEAELSLPPRPREPMFPELRDDEGSEDEEEVPITRRSLTRAFSQALKTQTSSKRPDKMVADPGDFNGDRSDFERWRTTMWAWLRHHRRTIIEAEDRCLAVWSRMKGPHAGLWGQTRMATCMSSGEWPNEVELWQELETLFLSKSVRDDARSKVQTLFQGSRRVEEWLVEWAALAAKAQIKGLEGVYLLERLCNKALAQELFTQGRRTSTVDGTMRALADIGRRQETYMALRGTREAAFAAKKAGSGTTRRFPPTQQGQRPQEQIEVTLRASTASRRATWPRGVKTPEY